MHTGKPNPAVPRILQQQPERPHNRQQQQSSGSGEYQPRQDADSRPQQMGESQRSQAVKDYQRNIKAYLEKADQADDKKAGATGLKQRESNRIG